MEKWFGFLDNWNVDQKQIFSFSFASFDLTYSSVRTLAIVFDYLYRAISTIAILCRLWLKSESFVPPIDRRIEKREAGNFIVNIKRFFTAIEFFGIYFLLLFLFLALLMYAISGKCDVYLYYTME